MKKQEKFISRMFHYLKGELCLIVKEFDRLEDAISDGVKAAVHSYKVYDMSGCICHDSHEHCDDDDYA